MKLEQDKLNEIIEFLNEFVLDRELDVFHHQLGITWACTRQESKWPAIDAPLFSKVFASWLTFVVHLHTNCLITPHLGIRLCHYIEGSGFNKCFAHGTDNSLNRLLDDPIICTFLNWAEGVMAFPYQSGMESWYRDLKRKSKRGDFPGSSSVLSRKIKPLKSAILTFGFDFEIKRDEKGASVMITKPGDGSCSQSSVGRQQPRAEKTAVNSSDDDDAIIKKLLQQTHTTTI